MSEQMAKVMRRAAEVREEVLREISGATDAELHYREGARWSVRDILVHLGNWEELANSSLRQVLRGKPPRLESLGDVHAFNAAELERCRHLDLQGALDYLGTTRTEAVAIVAGLTDKQVQADRRIATYARLATEHEQTHLHHIREMLARARRQPLEAAVSYLGYHRQRLLNRVLLEWLPADAFEWRTAPDKWSVREHLIHLAIWDREAAVVLTKMAAGQEYSPPFASVGLDEWNRQQVSARGYLTLACALHELGAARAALIAALGHLPPAITIDSEAVTGVIEEQREHDRVHVLAISKVLRGWQEAQS